MQWLGPATDIALVFGRPWGAQNVVNFCGGPQKVDQAMLNQKTVTFFFGRKNDRVQISYVPLREMYEKTYIGGGGASTCFGTGTSRASGINSQAGAGVRRSPGTHPTINWWGNWRLSGSWAVHPHQYSSSISRGALTRQGPGRTGD